MIIILLYWLNFWFEQVPFILKKISNNFVFLLLILSYFWILIFSIFIIFTKFVYLLFDLLNRDYWDLKKHIIQILFYWLVILIIKILLNFTIL